MKSQASKMSDRRALLKSGTLAGLAAVTGAFSVRGNEAQAPAAQTHDSPQSSPPKRQLGFMLAHEQFDVAQLVDLGVAAEHAGFDFVATSDHLQPWQDNQGHAGMAWVTMAALGQRTTRIKIGTTVTCPT